MKLIITILILIAVICFIFILQTPFHYPYFTYKIDITGKWSSKIDVEKLIVNWLTKENGASIIYDHEKDIQRWKAYSEEKAKNSVLSSLRTKQYRRALDDAHAYKFSLIRYYKNKPNVIDGRYSVSYKWLKDRFPKHFLNLIQEQTMNTVTKTPRMKNEHGTMANPVECEDPRKISAATKRAVLERDHYTCQICGISRVYVEGLCPGLSNHLSLEVDHIVSVKNGGSGDISNLQTLCRRCNNKKGGNRTNEEVAMELGMPYFRTSGQNSNARQAYETAVLCSDLELMDGCSLDTATRFAANRIKMNPEVINLLVNKVINSGVSPEYRGELFRKILVSLLNDNKI